MKHIFLLIAISSALIFVVSGSYAGRNKYLIFNTIELPSTPQKIEEITAHFEEISGCEDKVGLSHIFSYFRYDVEEVKNNLLTFLDSAEKTDTPVVIKLDGEQWLEARPDLWNWWDPTKPGYDPANVKNVEWTGWTPDRAMKIAWRNWGSQLRVLPPPNLMSPTYRRECHRAMDILLPVVMKWWRNLPTDKKDLFVAINVGWESSIGMSAFYYPNGNDYLDKPEADDPQSGTILADVLDRGLIQTGYNAVKTAGIRTEGDITEDDLVEVVRRHLEDLSRYVNKFGFPREKIFTHGVGNKDGEKLYDAAVNKYSCPGWSEYWHADDVTKDKGIMRNIQRSDAPYWAIVEYLLLRPYKNQQEWENALFTALSYPECKFLCVYNWEGINTEGSKVVDASIQVIKRLSKNRKD